MCFALSSLVYTLASAINNPFLNTQTVISAVALLYMASLFVKKSAASKLNFTIKDMAIDLAGLNFLVTININVQNPTNESFQINSLSGSLYINDSLAGNVSSFLKTSIVQNSQSVYPIMISIGFVGLGAEIYNYLTDPQSSVSLRVNGTANVDGIAIPVNITDKIL